MVWYLLKTSLFASGSWHECSVINYFNHWNWLKSLGYGSSRFKIIQLMFWLFATSWIPKPNSQSIPQNISTNKTSKSRNYIYSHNCQFYYNLSNQSLCQFYFTEIYFHSPDHAFQCACTFNGRVNLTVTRPNLGAFFPYLPGFSQNIKYLISIDLWARK